jgi:hypothetical protein
VVNAIGTPISKAVGPLATKDKLVQIVPGDGEFQAKLGRIFIWDLLTRTLFPRPWTG